MRSKPDGRSQRLSIVSLKAPSTGCSKKAVGQLRRVAKACDRCRMKKAKCDGQLPCKRCEDDGLICCSSAPSKIHYKKVPRGYAEVLENTQLIFIATIRKLYAMVQESHAWDLGEISMNQTDQPVVHEIAQKLGCIRSYDDFAHCGFPESAFAMRTLACELDNQQQRMYEDEFGASETDSPPAVTQFHQLNSELLKHGHCDTDLSACSQLQFSPEDSLHDKDWSYDGTAINTNPGSAFELSIATLPVFTSAYYLTQQSQLAAASETQANVLQAFISQDFDFDGNCSFHGTGHMYVA